MLTKKELIEFETEMAECFDAAMIRAPVHLYNGNEDQIIKVFKDHNIGPDDWVLCSWRSHYQCLLKGVPKDELKSAILQDISENCKTADLIILHTDWDEFKSLDFKKIAKKKNFKLYDLRNLYNFDEMLKKKINYYSVGRPVID